VLVDANRSSRNASSNELDKKLNVWTMAAPPVTAEDSPYPFDMLTLDKATAITNGVIVLTAKRDFEKIESFEMDEKAPNDDEDKSVFGEAFDDDDDDSDDDETMNNADG
jgi:hypothetical protein